MQQAPQQEFPSFVQLVPVKRRTMSEQYHDVDLKLLAQLQTEVHNMRFSKRPEFKLCILHSDGFVLDSSMLDSTQNSQQPATWDS